MRGAETRGAVTRGAVTWRAVTWGAAMLEAAMPGAVMREPSMRGPARLKCEVVGWGSLTCATAPLKTEMRDSSMCVVAVWGAVVRRAVRQEAARCEPARQEAARCRPARLWAAGPESWMHLAVVCEAARCVTEARGAVRLESLIWGLALKGHARLQVVGLESSMRTVAAQESSMCTIAAQESLMRVAETCVTVMLGLGSSMRVVAMLESSRMLAVQSGWG